MKDLCGHDLMIGDVVVTYGDGERKTLIRGTISGFTAKNVKVAVEYSNHQAEYLRRPERVALYDR